MTFCDPEKWDFFNFVYKTYGKVIFLLFLAVNQTFFPLLALYISSCAWQNVVAALYCVWQNVVKPMECALA